MEAAVLEKWAGLEKWLRSRKQPVCGLACHVPSQPQKGVIEVLGLGKEEVEGFRLGDLFCWDFRELPALCKVQISQQSSVWMGQPREIIPPPDRGTVQRQHRLLTRGKTTLLALSE